MNNDDLKETASCYFDDYGKMIFKAEHHLERGSCCFSYCLHCPYGTTVEKYKISVHQDSAQKIIFKLKGYPCAELSTESNVLNIYPRFQLQDLEDEINSALDIFYKGKGAR